MVKKWDYTKHPGGPDAWERYQDALQKLAQLRADPTATTEQVRDAELEVSRWAPSNN